MSRRLRTTGLAGSGALLLVLAMSGVVAAASILTAVVAPVPDPTDPVATIDTSQTFEDLNGDGIDDDCQADVVANPDAAAAADLAVDLNGDGQVSVSEAAQSDRTGGPSCNHGGFVSGVADPTDTETDTETTTPATCDTTVAPTETAPAEDATETTLEATVEARNAHGTTVAAVAQSDAVGGANCNHGGAVSEAAKKDQTAAKAARDAAKGAREAQREARKQTRTHGHKG
jgi:hypothetical protein